MKENDNDKLKPSISNDPHAKDIPSSSSGQPVQGKKKEGTVPFNLLKDLIVNNSDRVIEFLVSNIQPRFDSVVEELRKDDEWIKENTQVLLDTVKQSMKESKDELSKELLEVLRGASKSSEDANAKVALQKEYQERDIKYQLLLAQIEEKETYLKNLKDKIAVAEEQSKVIIQNALTEYQNRIDNAVKEVIKMKEDAERDIDNVTRSRLIELDSLEEKLQELRSQVESTQTEFSTLENQVNERTQYVRDLELKVNTLSLRVRALEAEEEELSESVVKLRHDHDTINGALLEKSNAYVQLQSDWNELSEKLASATKEYEETVEFTDDYKTFVDFHNKQEKFISTMESKFTEKLESFQVSTKQSATTLGHVVGTDGSEYNLADLMLEVKEELTPLTELSAVLQSLKEQPVLGIKEEVQEALVNLSNLTKKDIDENLVQVMELQKQLSTVEAKLEVSIVDRNNKGSIIHDLKVLNFILQDEMDKLNDIVDKLRTRGNNYERNTNLTALNKEKFVKHWSKVLIHKTVEDLEKEFELHCDTIQNLIYYVTKECDFDSTYDELIINFFDEHVKGSVVIPKRHQIRILMSHTSKGELPSSISGITFVPVNESNKFFYAEIDISRYKLLNKESGELYMDLVMASKPKDELNNILSMFPECLHERICYLSTISDTVEDLVYIIMNTLAVAVTGYDETNIKIDETASPEIVHAGIALRRDLASNGYSDPIATVVDLMNEFTSKYDYSQEDMVKLAPKFTREGFGLTGGKYILIGGLTSINKFSGIYVELDKSSISKEEIDIIISQVSFEKQIQVQLDMEQSGHPGSGRGLVDVHLLVPALYTEIK